MKNHLRHPLGFSFFQASYSTPNMVRAGIEAEKHGFQSVMIGDHYLDLSGLVKVDPWTVLAYIGSKTRKIRLTTYVTDVLRTHPSKVAHIAATLDELTGGRVTIGLGAGESMNLIPFGIGFDDQPAARVERLREGIQVIRLLQGSSEERKVDYDGQYYHLRAAWLQQRPVQKYLPIGIGALGARRSLQLIGELGDAWLPAYNTLKLFRERVAIIKESARSFGRDPRKIQYFASILGVLSKDQKMIAKAVDAYRGSILSLAPKQVKKLAGLPSLFTVDPKYDYQQVIPGDPVIGKMGLTVSQVPDQVVEDFLVIGSADQMVEAIAAYKKAGATNVLFWDMVAEGLLDSLPLAVRNMKTIQEKVMPHFQ
jgi:phthiodiolone/phenolphthiodiolone dimycocerosates ketoreductase